MKPILPLVILSGLCLAGCITQQQIALPGGTAAPPARIVRLTPAISNVTVAAGSTVLLVKSFSINPDCSPLGYNSLRITQEPVHGTAVVTEGRDYPSYRAGNPRSACNKKKLPAMLLKYTPEDDFTGSDFLATEVISEDGSDSKHQFSITVK